MRHMHGTQDYEGCALCGSCLAKAKSNVWRLSLLQHFMRVRCVGHRIVVLLTVVVVGSDLVVVQTEGIRNAFFLFLYLLPRCYCDTPRIMFWRPHFIALTVSNCIYSARP